jgi:hypothetical protein
MLIGVFDITATALTGTFVINASTSKYSVEYGALPATMAVPVAVPTELNIGAATPETTDEPKAVPTELSIGAETPVTAAVPAAVPILLVMDFPTPETTDEPAAVPKLPVVGNSERLIDESGAIPSIYFAT